MMAVDALPSFHPPRPASSRRCLALRQGVASPPTADHNISRSSFAADVTSVSAFARASAASAPSRTHPHRRHPALRFAPIKKLPLQRDRTENGRARQCRWQR
jgi:hypothetical protein